jgi:hypothetical protein
LQKYSYLKLILHILSMRRKIFLVKLGQKWLCFGGFLSNITHILQILKQCSFKSFKKNNFMLKNNIYFVTSRNRCPDKTSGDITYWDKTSVRTKCLAGQNIQRNKTTGKQNVCGDKTSGDIISVG